MDFTAAPQLPIVDMHCDLLVYLTDVAGSEPNKVEEIGCALPALTEGNVKLQVMAIYSATEPGSTDYARLQSKMFRQLANSNACLAPVSNAAALRHTLQSSNAITGMVAAIENASGFCEEHEPLENGFKRLEQIIQDCERILYISFTHHAGNRFGGGNTSDKGITDDGKAMLDYLNGRRIAVDLSHTSDPLAHDILNHIDAHHLDISILASHSNFRPVWEHNRNLPDELTQEIIRRGGLIGINFLRHFLGTEDPDALVHHILYGLEQGAHDAICFGADYFYHADHPDPERFPFYYKVYEHAGISYRTLLNKLQQKLTKQQLEKLAYSNAAGFIFRLWEE